MRHMQIENGLTVNLLQTKKFKTNVIAVLIRTPLTKENATLNSVLSGVLGSGFKKFGNEQKIAVECENMYGAELETGVVKKGEEHIIQLYFECVNDRLCKEPLLDRAGELMKGLLFEPLVSSSGFKAEYTNLKIERQRGIIAGRINDKRKYARERCIEVMCSEEPFGVSGDGYEEYLDKITPKSLHKHYEKISNSSPVDIFILGDIGAKHAEDWARQYFLRGSESILDCEPAVLPEIKNGLKRVEENQSLNQGKLVIGARCGFELGGEGFYKYLLLNELFGGGSNSKLFKNVREARGLCYYVGSVIYRAKSIMLIEAGIDKKDCDEALELITRQLELIKSGEISEDEISCAKNSMISQMETLKDSPQSLANFCMTNALLGDRIEISELRHIFNGFSKNDLCESAGEITLDTAYFLA